MKEFFGGVISHGEAALVFLNMAIVYALVPATARDLLNVAPIFKTNLAYALTLKNFVDLYRLKD